MEGRFALLIAAIPAIVFAQPAVESANELRDPIKILRKVDAASKAVNAVKYTGRLEGKAAAESRMLLVEGTVLMSGWRPPLEERTRGAPARYRCDVTTAEPYSGEVRRLTIGTDGASFYLIDHDARKVYAGPQPEVLGSMSRPAVAIWLREFVHPTPFSDELTGDAQALEGSRKIGDEDCYEIRIIYKDAVGEAVWWFSKRDFLPRGVQRFLTTPSGERAIQQWQITNLVVDPKLSDDAFKLVIPPGYTKIDGPAP